ncbi:hypothetical protein MTO96_023850 [Rhipicephalus appendiculatus]
MATCDDFGIDPFSFHYTKEGKCVVQDNVAENGTFIFSGGCTGIFCLGYERKIQVYGCPRPQCVEDVYNPTVPGAPIFQTMWPACC